LPFWTVGAEFLLFRRNLTFGASRSRKRYLLPARRCGYPARLL